MKDAEARNFVVLHVGRCGSTVLRRQMVAGGELVHDGEAFAQRYGLQKEKHPDLTPSLYLERRQKFARRQGLIYGLEVKYLTGTQLERIGISRSGVPAYFTGLGFGKFVLLSRRNGLDRLISQMVVKQRGSYTRTDGDAGAVPRLSIDPDRIKIGTRVLTLVEALEALEAETDEMRAVLGASGADMIEITYEDHIQEDPNRAGQAVADHVGIGFTGSAPQLKKVVTTSKADLIENFGEVADRLAGTRFGWMLGRTEGRAEHG